MTVLADNIRYLLNRFEGGQDAFADKFKVSQGTVSRWIDETKPSEPKLEPILALAQYARVTVGTLVNIPAERWELEGRPYMPTDEELVAMVERAHRRVPASVPIGEWPRKVAEGLRTDLEKALAGGRV